MTEYERLKRLERGNKYEGWAFTFCKAAFLVLLLGKYALFALSGLATVLYIVAATKGVREWRCWAKPPYVTVFWAVICLAGRNAIRFRRSCGSGAEFLETQQGSGSAIEWHV
jgi:hypothetical protein